MALVQWCSGGFFFSMSTWPFPACQKGSRDVLKTDWQREKVFFKARDIRLPQQLPMFSPVTSHGLTRDENVIGKELMSLIDELDRPSRNSEPMRWTKWLFALKQ